VLQKEKKDKSAKKDKVCCCWCLASPACVELYGDHALNQERTSLLALCVSHGTACYLHDLPGKLPKGACCMNFTVLNARAERSLCCAVPCCVLQSKRERSPEADAAAPSTEKKKKKKKKDKDGSDSE
jgi:hypothetical protein